MHRYLSPENDTLYTVFSALVLTFSFGGKWTHELPAEPLKFTLERDVTGKLLFLEIFAESRNDIKFKLINT